MIPDSQLTKVLLRAFRQDTLGLLSHLEKLKYCYLSSDFDVIRDLSPLQQLACLTKSHCEGLSSVFSLMQIVPLDIFGARWSRR